MAHLGHLVQHLLNTTKPEKFKFVEVGVFKGDNALEVVSLLISNRIEKENIYYVGFDIFEDLNGFKDEFPEDFSLYDKQEWPYWEYTSGLHTYNQVAMKLSAVLPLPNCRLIKGDSRVEIEKNISLISDASMIYIDGCHDYMVVREDWANTRFILEKNDNLVIAFDDAGYEGVKRVKNEISLDGNCKVLDLNDDQFFVVSSKCRVF